ncbi:hypothetical protein KEM56_003750, partial [Ascosphaera pollenicola]
ISQLWIVAVDQLKTTYDRNAIMRPRFVLDEENAIDTIESDDIDDARTSRGLPNDDKHRDVTYDTTPKGMSIYRQENRSNEPSSSILGSEDSPRTCNAQVEDHGSREHGYVSPTESSGRCSSTFVSLGNKRRYILPSTPTKKGSDHGDPILDKSSPLMNGNDSITPRHTLVTPSYQAARSGTYNRLHREMSDDDDGDIMSPTVERNLKTPMLSMTPLCQQTSGGRNLSASVGPDSSRQNRRFVFQDPRLSIGSQPPSNKKEPEASSYLKTTDSDFERSKLPQMRAPNFGCASPIRPKRLKQPVNFIPGGLAADLRSWIINADAHKAAIDHAIYGSAHDTLSRDPALDEDMPTPIFDANKYAVVATITNAVGNDAKKLQERPTRYTFVLACSRSSCTKDHAKKTGVQHIFDIEPQLEQKILLLGPPREKPRNWANDLPKPDNTLFPGDVIGLRHGLIWEINLPNTLPTLVPCDSTKQYSSGTMKNADQESQWIVAVEWDILSKESHTVPN